MDYRKWNYNNNSKKNKICKKHAFLIVAHKDNNVFRTLIKLLDHENNDIYVHMDKRNKSYDERKISNLVKKCNFVSVDRKKVSWGDFSIVDAEIRLLEAARKNNRYMYYHFISGEDLPLKSQEYIHKFFENNQGFEFLRFEKETFTYNNRVRYYYWLQNILGRNNSILGQCIRKISLYIQKLFKVQRNKNIIFQKGTNWCSITDDFASYVISNKCWVKKTFNHTFCSDEMFFHTLLINSSFKDRLYHKKFDNNLHSIMRLIDWKRGKPYTFKTSDFYELNSSDYLFARKFQSEIDDEIVNKIYNELSKKNI